MLREKSAEILVGSAWVQIGFHKPVPCGAENFMVEPHLEPQRRGEAKPGGEHMIAEVQ